MSETVDKMVIYGIIYIIIQFEIAAIFGLRKTMSEVIGYKDVEEKVLIIREQSVIIDRDVAVLYGVFTKDINRAVKNNPDKFPEGYIIDLTVEEWGSLRLKI